MDVIIVDTRITVIVVEDRTSIAVYGGQAPKGIDGIDGNDGDPGADSIFTAKASGAEAAGGIDNEKGITALALASVTGWHEQAIDGGAFIAGSDLTDGGEYVTDETTTNKLVYDAVALDSGATEERYQAKIQAPPGWDLSTIKVKQVWTNEAGASPGDTVELGVRAVAIRDGDPVDSAWGPALVVSDSLEAAGDLQTTAATGPLSPGGTPAAGCTIWLEGYRNTDGADTMAEKCRVARLLVMFKLTNERSGY